MYQAVCAGLAVFLGLAANDDPKPAPLPAAAPTTLLDWLWQTFQQHKAQTGEYPESMPISPALWPGLLDECDAQCKSPIPREEIHRIKVHGVVVYPG